MKRSKLIGILVFLLIFCLSGSVFAESLNVATSQSILITVNDVDKVAVANPDIADVVVVSSSEVLVVGKTPGKTTLHIWTVNGARMTYEVEVGANDTAIAETIQNILGYTNIKVSKVNKTVILEGSVEDQYQKNRAEKVAAAYGEKVVNLLELSNPKQVKIEAKIIEIAKDKVDNLGIKYGNNPLNPGSFYAGQSLINQNSIPGQGQIFGWFGSYGDINAQINALIKNGYAKILSQPNIVTISGEKANILIGGEIPVPINVDDNKITVEWKEYGIKLAISPEVNSNGLIASSVKAEVSSIDYASSTKINIGDNLVIPPLKTRKAESVITMPSGNTMAIGGLISSDESKYVTKFPILGSLPIIGKFFTDKSTIVDKKEILILITPTLITSNDYTPYMSLEMKDFNNKNPWSEKDVAKK